MNRNTIKLLRSRSTQVDRTCERRPVLVGTKPPIKFKSEKMWRTTAKPRDKGKRKAHSVVYSWCIFQCFLFQVSGLFGALASGPCMHEEVHRERAETTSTKGVTGVFSYAYPTATTVCHNTRHNPHSSRVNHTLPGSLRGALSLRNNNISSTCSTPTVEFEKYELIVLVG